MSGQGGQPQPDPMDSEGVPPSTPEGVQQQHREVFLHVSISPSSLVSTPGEGVQQHLDTPTPTRPTEGWDLDNSSSPSAWTSNPDNPSQQNTEPVQDHGTTTDWTTTEYQNPHYQVEPVQSHVTANASNTSTQDQDHLTGDAMNLDQTTPSHLIQHLGSSPQSIPSTPQNTITPNERIVTLQ